MHDQVSPSPGEPEPSGAVSREATADVMGQVTAWYNREILAERRAPGPDPERLEQLIARRRECVQDRARLEEAEGEEAARIGALYAARLKELEATGP
ncbi:hypothetical protein [Streptomyces scopuliridis]|uniref:hypothetical protein n=1 Tax=Streptomyces scopuliridis TaxID=452529 RepID=UPI0036C6D5DF